VALLLVIAPLLSRDTVSLNGRKDRRDVWIPRNRKNVGRTVHARRTHRRYLVSFRGAILKAWIAYTGLGVYI
jgi:hypothetical protein